MASENIKASHFEAIITKQSLIIKVAERYFKALAAQDNIQLTASEIKLAKRQLLQAEQRLNAGLGTITEVYESKAQLDISNATHIDAQNQLQNSLELLREITNQQHTSLAPLKESVNFSHPIGPDKPQLLKEALKSNKEILLLRQQNNSLQREIKIQRNAHFPTLDLVASYTNMTTGGGNFGQSKTEDSSISLQLNIPIYQGGAINSRTKTAILKHKTHVSKLDAKVRAIRSQFNQSYRGIYTSVARIKSLANSLKSNRKALEAIETENKVGLRTTTDVFHMSKSLQQTKRDFLKAKYDYIQNILRLRFALGNLSVEDLNTFNLLLD